MANHTDLKYARMLEFHLDKFVCKSEAPYKFNFRCYVCGDSKKSDSKARGWLMEGKSGHFVYTCFNCGERPSFKQVLRDNAPHLYDDYIAERFLGGNSKEAETGGFDFTTPLDFTLPAKADEPEEDKTKGWNDQLHNIRPMSSLKETHRAYAYLRSRKIPKLSFDRLFYAHEFNKWVNSFTDKKLSEKYDEPRIVIPFFDEEKNLFGFTGRSMNPNTNLRYMTIMLDSDKPKVFGLDNVDKSKEVFVLEGAFDSLFLPNAIAMAGADVHLEGLGITKATYIFDNEPRNREIVKRMEKVIGMGYRVAILPHNENKDLNDRVLAGEKPIEIYREIKKHTYQGLLAQIQLTAWKRCKTS